MICGSCARKHGAAIGGLCAHRLPEGAHRDAIPLSDAQLRPIAERFMRAIDELDAEIDRAIEVAR